MVSWASHTTVNRSDARFEQRRIPSLDRRDHVGHGSDSGIEKMLVWVARCCPDGAWRDAVPPPYPSNCSSTPPVSSQRISRFGWIQFSQRPYHGGYPALRPIGCLRHSGLERPALANPGHPWGHLAIALVGFSRIGPRVPHLSDGLGAVV